MKHLFAFFLFLPVFSFAQQCKINKTKDPFSQAPKLSTGFLPLSVGALSIDADAKEIDFFIALNNFGESKCFDNSSTASIQFDDDRSKLNYRNTGTMNCEGLFHFTFKNSTTTPSALQRLATKKIKTITLTGSNKTTTVITPTEQQKQILSDMVTCMIKESKTLL